MFDPDSMVKFSKITTDALEAKPHKDHALKMARESIVLLRNENNLLPLKKSLKKIAVIGPNADNANTQLGNYNGQPSVVTTVLQGIKEKLGSTVEIFYSKATNFVDSAHPDFSKLVDSVKDYDVLIYVGGISPRLEGEEMKVSQQGFKGGDRTSINLPLIQTEFMRALKATGKPVVFVMMTGSAIAIPWEAENIPGIINAWYGGQAAGTAVADVLFGDYNPSGRLPVTFYKSDDDLPAFEDYSMANRTYRYFKGVPLYPFGFGLSFSKIEYSNLKLLQSTRVTRNNLSITVTVTNKSNVPADEVVQVYLSYQGVSFAPQYALKDFKRITLNPGASQTISFTLFNDKLRAIDENGRPVFLQGRVNVIVGGSSPGKRSEELGAAKPVDATMTLKDFQNQ
jgi:beta-glucosidase